MIITKKMAEEAARKIAKPIMEKRNAAKVKLCEYVTEQAEKQVPSEVMKLYSTHPRYVKKESSQYFRDISTTVNFTRSIPSVSYGETLEVTDKIRDHLLKLHNAIQDADKQYEETKTQIEVTLVSLRTYNRVKDQMPEALPFLPAPGTTTTAIAMPLQPLRNTIKKLAKAATA